MSISLAALELLSGLAKVRDEVLVAPASSRKGDYCPVQMKVMPPGRSLHLSPSVYLDLRKKQSSSCRIASSYPNARLTGSSKVNPVNASWLKAKLRVAGSDACCSTMWFWLILLS